MAGKIVLCRCEDVTLSDVEHSVSRGYKDIEGSPEVEAKELPEAVQRAIRSIQKRKK
jgi:hypothetical protein